jgi:hypothetical protein
MGMILSLVFVFFVFALGGDIISIQFIYSDIDSVSMTAGYMIAKDGNLTAATKFVNDQNMTLECNETGTPLFGDTWIYFVAKEYDPLIIKNEAMTIRIERSTVIGYYN